MRWLLLAAIALAGCRGEKIVYRMPKMSADGAKVLGGEMSAFSTSFLTHCAAATPGKNICVSPASAATALTMLRNGVSGPTETELATALGQTGPVVDVNKRFADFLSTAHELEQREVLTMANAIWCAKSASLRSGYTADMAASFGANVRPTDFPDPGLKEVNEWVKKETRNRIPSIFDRLDRSTIAVLVNAVWFKDKWTEPFDKSETRKGDFNLESGEKVKVDLMSKSHADYSYYKGSDISALKLAFKNECSFLAAVPSGKIAAAMASQEWADLLSSKLTLKPTSGAKVTMPKFRIESKIDAKPVLQAMGVRTCFGMNADLSKMMAGKAWVDQVQHRTYFAADEEGVEAAAATGETVAASIASDDEFIIDGPFLFAVLDPNGIPLFVGVCYDPR